MKTSRKTKYFFILFSTIFSFILAEFVLWLMGFRINTLKDAQELDKLKPNTTAVSHGEPGKPNEFNVVVHYNSLGFHDKEHSFDKPTNTVRVLFIGDSYIEAVEVPFEKTVYRQLEQKLNQQSDGKKYEVISLGVHGAAPRQYWGLLLNPGLKFKPDIVIMEFLPQNDISGTTPELIKQWQRWQKRTYSYRIIKDNAFNNLILSSRTISLAAFIVDSFLPQFRMRNLPPSEKAYPEWFSFCRKPPDPQLWEWGWQVTENSYKQMKKDAENAGADFYLVSFTSEFEIDAYKGKNRLPKEFNDFDCDPRYPSKRIYDIAVRNNIKFLNLNPLFAIHEQKTNRHAHYRYDRHWNETGHTWAAEEIMNIFGKKLLAREPKK